MQSFSEINFNVENILYIFKYYIIVIFYVHHILKMHERFFDTGLLP